jgi:hypothetical protein
MFEEVEEGKGKAEQGRRSLHEREEVHVDQARGLILVGIDGAFAIPIE